MADWSIVQKTSFAFGDRFDPEFYQHAFQHVRGKLAHCRTLHSCLSDISYGLQAEPDYLSEGTEYIRAMNLNAPWIENEILRINPQQIPNDDYRLKYGDILITRSGANCGAVGLITERFTGATYGSYTIRLRVNDTINPFVLFAFFLTDVGKSLTLQARYGSAQPNLSIPYLRHLILVPTFPDSISSKVEAVLKECVQSAHSEMRLYQEVELELLDRLGWEKPKNQQIELSYVRKFSDLFTAARSDAEFFQPQHARLRAQLIKHGAQAISAFCTRPSRGVQPLLVEGGDVVVIDSKAVRAQGVAPGVEERTSRVFYDLPQNQKSHVEHGDVLLNSTGRGTLGRAAYYQLNEPALCDNHVSILRPNPKICDPIYLALFLNSPVGVAQSEQFQTGSSGQLEIYPDHIQQFLVYIPRQSDGKVDIAWQTGLAAKITSAAASKTRARVKLQEAKNLVEKAISG